MDLTSKPHPRSSARQTSWGRRLPSLVTLAASLGLAAVAVGTYLGPVVGPGGVACAAEPTTSYGMPRLAWRTAPPQLHLQPERARLVLRLPPELMPPPDNGALRVPFDPNKHFEFASAGRYTRATIGASMSLHIDDYKHTLRFHLNLMPRGAVALLRFDPLAKLR